MRAIKRQLLLLMIAVMAFIPVLAFPASAYASPPSDTDVVTRDHFYDKETNKEFLTIQDRDGNVFYLVIDYDSPIDEKEEQFKTYFLNPVDASDLESLIQEEETKPITCTCKEKCIPGKIDMTCPVCATNMAECMGKETEPPTEPMESSEPTEPTADKPSETKVNPASLVGLVVLLFGGAFAVIKKKKDQKPMTYAHDQDDYEYEEEEWVNENDDGGEESEEVSE